MSSKFEYVFYTNRAYEIAQNISGNYDGYIISWKPSGYNAELFFRSKNIFDNKIKQIGILCYNEKSKNITYLKTGFIESAHKYKKADSIGINWDILSHLSAAKDQILITEKMKMQKEKRYLISAFKALRMATPERFKHFSQQGYEKQVFIPCAEFKVIEGK